MPIANLSLQQRLYYEDTGGDKPAIVFSHGLLMDHSMFAPQIEHLRQTYRCIAWDERGHGGTEQVPDLSPFTYWDAAEDLAHLLQYLGIERAIFVGMSQGGFQSLRCALSYPGLARALILIGTQTGPEDPMHVNGNAALADSWLAEGPSEALLDNAQRILLGEQWNGAAPWREKWWHFQPRHFLECLSTMGERIDLTSRLAEINIPALVLHGSNDRAIPVTKAQALARGLRAELVLIEGAGHAANLTHPAAANAAIERFLTALN